jgi:catechol 2,3-dioxygenase-like lactoylglutathione lyase family enzyme
MKLVQIALVIDDYDKAITFYTQKLKFKLLENTQINENKRWVVIAPDANLGCHILLAKATNEEQKNRIGNQTGGRVFLFLHTNDIESDYLNLIANEIKIHREISTEIYGKVLVFEDLYGNLWDLIEPIKSQ